MSSFSATFEVNLSRIRLSDEIDEVYLSSIRLTGALVKRIYRVVIGYFDSEEKKPFVLNTDLSKVANGLYRFEPSDANRIQVIPNDDKDAQLAYKWTFTSSLEESDDNGITWTKTDSKKPAAVRMPTSIGD